jgi:hypothetical protein
MTFVRLLPAALLACLPACSAGSDPHSRGNETPTTAGGSSAGSGGGANGGSAGDAATLALLPARIRRLANAEYDASVRALLGTTKSPSEERSFPPDARQGPSNAPAGAAFTVNDAQRVDPVLADKLDSAAQALVEEARQSGKLSALAPCADPAATGEACAQSFLRGFGAKAFRRALTDEEVASLLPAYHVGADGYAYEDGIALLTRILLQSPGFLYVTELGAGDNAASFELTPEEIAAELSYLFTSGPPDNELASRAAELRAPTTREEQARRLLATPSGQARLVRLVQEWLGIEHVARREKALSVYPEFATLSGSIEHESSVFIDEVLQRSTGTLSELLTADWTIADEGLAAFYGVTWAGAGARTSLAGTARRGILNQAAFLSVFASNNGSHPVFRGVALMRRIACLTTPDPGALGIVVSVPPAAPDKTTRERFAVHTTDPGCKGCHDTIDAFGFSLESFDGIGKLRATDNGRPVDTQIALQAGASFDGEYADSTGLIAALAQSDAVKSCLARQLFRGSAGRSDASVANVEQSFVELWKQLPAPQSERLADVLVAFAASPLFVQRRAQ